MNIIKKTVKLLGINFLPATLAHLLLLPFWLIHIPFLSLISSVGSHFVNIFILPGLIGVLNFQFNTRHKVKSFALNGLLMLISMGFWNLLNYINWSISGGEFFILNPDWETIGLLKLVIITNLISVLAVIAGFQIYYFVRPKKEEDALLGN